MTFAPEPLPGSPKAPQFKPRRRVKKIKPGADVAPAPGLPSPGSESDYSDSEPKPDLSHLRTMVTKEHVEVSFGELSEVVRPLTLECSLPLYVLILQ